MSVFLDFFKISTSQSARFFSPCTKGVKPLHLNDQITYFGDLNFSVLVALSYFYLKKIQLAQKYSFLCPYLLLVSSCTYQKASIKEHKLKQIWIKLHFLLNMETICVFNIFYFCLFLKLYWAVRLRINEISEL